MSSGALVAWAAGDLVLPRSMVTLLPTELSALNAELPDIHALDAELVGDLAAGAGNLA